MMKELVIISAAPFEATPLNAHFAKCPLDLKIHYLSCGVGAINAAKSARELNVAVSGKDVVFIGTAGVFTIDFSRPYLVTTDRIIWLPPCVRHGLAYTVKDSAKPICLEDTPAPMAKGLEPCTTICSPTISLDGSLPEDMMRGECLENLELYSVASELKSAARSLSIVLAVTNVVGPTAHAQWLKNYRKAASLTADLVFQRVLSISEHS